MRYLVDANVLSEATKPRPNELVIEWLTANERNLVADPIIIGELFIGILALPRGRKRTLLERWFAEVTRTLECLPWDASVGRRWAAVVIELRRNGRTLPLLDSMIAATALEHDLTVATRNRSHFEPAGVRVVDPFA